MPSGLQSVRRGRWVGMLAVLLVHLLLVSWLTHSWQAPPPHREGRRSTLRMVTIQLPPLPAPAARPSQRPTPSAGSVAVRREPSPQAQPPASRPPQPDQPTTLLTQIPATQTPTPPLAATPPASAPSGPSGHDLMYGDATRLAIRQGTRNTPLLSERANEASQAPDRGDASARLGKEIQNAGAGDCLKGDYAGAGMGLLSAPFLALAAVRGKCAK